MALKDISFHVKAKHKKVKQLVPKLTREHRAYIASKFDKMKFKETLPSPEVFAEHLAKELAQPWYQCTSSKALVELRNHYTTT